MMFGGQAGAWGEPEKTISVGKRKRSRYLNSKILGSHFILPRVDNKGREESVEHAIWSV